jgi:neutral trehalase
VIKKDFPKVHYYDQDFVDIYNRSWAWIQDNWFKGDSENRLKNSFFNHKENTSVDLFETCMSTFFLVYYNMKYPVAPMLDNFYLLQEENGAIRSNYNVETSEPVFTEGNPEGASPPLLAWVEYNLYHKVGQKKRIKEIMPHLERYYTWLDETFKDQDSGLYEVPLEATKMTNSPRSKMKFAVDFNSQQALNSLYMSALGDILNDKELSFKYKKQYFSLKTRINTLMWNQDDNLYYDLDEDLEQVQVKTAASFWPLLAEIPNEARAEGLIENLKDPDSFGTDNPFPSLAVSEPDFDKKGNGFCGSVYPFLTFMIIKGLEKYGRYDFARECSIRHMYYILDTFHPDGNKKGTLWEAYSPTSEGPAIWKDENQENKQLFLTYAALSTITLMIENIVGLYISLPRKTVDWIVPTLELMGIEDLSLKRNMITILSNKSGRGWEIRLESEKLYYFTIDILGEKKKTLPIPSGKCSMLIDKL